MRSEIKPFAKLFVGCIFLFGIGFICIQLKSVSGYIIGIMLFLSGLAGIIALVYRILQIKADPKAASEFAVNYIQAQQTLSSVTTIKGAYESRQAAQQQRVATVASYAQQAGWQVAPGDEPTLSTYVSDDLLSNLGPHTYAMSYAFVCDQKPAHIFQYTYYRTINVDQNTRLSDRNLPSEYYQKPTSSFILAVDINKPFPKIYLARHSALSGLIGYEHQENLKLEGDFNTFFDVFIPQGQEQEALEILQPDLMQLMIQSGKNFDVQIRQNSILFVSDDNFNQPPIVSELAAYATKYLQTAGL